MSRPCSSTSSPKPPRQLLVPDAVHPAHHTLSQPQQIYVLSADGSSLFLLDPSKPHSNEEPPPYASVHLEGSGAGEEEGHGGGATASPVRTGVPYPQADTLGIVGGRRLRANTVSGLGITTNARPRVGSRYHSSTSQRGLADPSSSSDGRWTRSVNTTPIRSVSRLPDENTPLLGYTTNTNPIRGMWTSVFCGEVEAADEERTWGEAWKRFWSPVGDSSYWRAMLHLWLINFPFALILWPPLLVGTLVGTATLIVLPVGISFWWLTLYITRSAARLETIVQIHHHSPLSPIIPMPAYHPIFHRIREPSLPSSPSSTSSDSEDIIWETRFITCSYAMFSDYYSYSALSYFLLIKPLITLFSTILLIALLPISVVLVFAFPVYLRAARRWGKWQAGVALENL